MAALVWRQQPADGAEGREQERWREHARWRRRPGPRHQGAGVPGRVADAQAVAAPSGQDIGVESPRRTCCGGRQGGLAVEEERGGSAPGLTIPSSRGGAGGNPAAGGAVDGGRVRRCGTAAEGSADRAAMGPAATAPAAAGSGRGRAVIGRRIRSHIDESITLRPPPARVLYRWQRRAVFRGGDDPVLPERLAMVLWPCRRGRWRLGLFRFELGDAGAEGDQQLLLAGQEEAFGEGGAAGARGRPWRCRGRCREQDDELLAAVAADGVLRADVLADHVGEVLQASSPVWWPWCR